MRVVRRVRRHMHKIRFEDFAREEKCSMGYLSYFMKKTMGQSFQQYMNAVRLNATRKRIASGEAKMLDVHMRAGLSDCRCFPKTFQTCMGMTPEAYGRERQPAAPRKARCFTAFIRWNSFIPVKKPTDAVCAKDAAWPCLRLRMTAA